MVADLLRRHNDNILWIWIFIGTSMIGRQILFWSSWSCFMRSQDLVLGRTLLFGVWIRARGLLWPATIELYQVCLLLLFLEKLFGNLELPLVLLSLFGRWLWVRPWPLTTFGSVMCWFWIGVACARREGSLLTIFFSVALLHGRYGLWLLLSLVFLGLCWVALWRCWSVGRVILGSIRTFWFGKSFLIVWCGAFGANVMGVVLRIVNGRMVRLSSFYDLCLNG